MGLVEAFNFFLEREQSHLSTCTLRSGGGGRQQQTVNHNLNAVCRLKDEIGSD